ncbi:MAG TPA: hypothetical protein VN843_26255, partial [Anaerolineales bacterium]|nr:hypothetical protein [Anaerolineales bacterium]
MKEEILTDAVLREFLLGRGDDEERARIEGLFLTDSEAREKILIIEQELAEDYLEDNLNPADREKFLLRYGQTSAQLQQLRITKAIKDWALRENASQTVPAGFSIWERLRGSLWLKPVFVVPIAVAAIIAVVVGGVWVNSRMKRAALELELVQLNSPASLRENPSQMSAMELTPIAVRSLERGNEFKKTNDVSIVELRLPWIKKERYSTYKAEVRRVDGTQSFTLPQLQAENDGVSIIRLRLFTNNLSRGQYQILLSGIDNGG